MNKQELIDRIAETAELPKATASRVLGALTETITDAMKNGDKITLVGFGTFQTRDRAARIGRNPHTGESIEVPRTRLPVFKPGSALREAVAEKH